MSVEKYEVTSQDIDAAEDMLSPAQRDASVKQEEIMRDIQLSPELLAEFNQSL